MTLFTQVCAQFLWVFIWYSLGEVGNDQVRIKNPIVVDNESARLNHSDYGQSYYITYLFLFSFVSVHQTISI